MIDISSLYKDLMPKKLTEHILLGKKMINIFDKGDLNFDKLINISILSTGTTKLINEVLISQCSSFGVFAKIYNNEYDQYAQDIFNINSNFYKSQPELVIINIDVQAIATEYVIIPYKKSFKEREIWSKETATFLFSLVDKVRESSSAKVVLHNLEVPDYSPLGLIENKDEYGYIESIEEVNRILMNGCKSRKSVYLYNYNAFCSRLGKDNIHDAKMHYMGDIHINPKFYVDLCLDYAKYIQAIIFPAKKCIIVDLDNTLWGGIIGESGVKSIHLGPTLEGRAFMEFQQYLYSLNIRGIILAINSKNNFSDAIDVIRNHPFMVLKESFFSAIRINWKDKVSNIKSIAQELNIGLDSLVFIDDDPVNRDMVKEFLPEVLVVDMPKDSSNYVDMIKNINCFNVLALTEEDLLKKKMYHAQKKRNELRELIPTDIETYLKMLDITVYIEEANSDTVPRVSQLTQKTNQFNLTTIRYSEEEIMHLLKRDNYRIITISLKDKFGDNGLTGLAIIKKYQKESVWFIEAFLLSCRIIGRGTEDVLLAYIINQAKEENIRYVHGRFVESEKNEQCKDYYEKNLFVRDMTNNHYKDIWVFNTEKTCKFPDFMNYYIK